MAQIIAEGANFRKAQHKIQPPAKLRHLIVDLIDKEQWSSLSADVKGDANAKAECRRMKYEVLLTSAF